MYNWGLWIMTNKIQSDFLFAQPSFASGVARLLDLMGQFDDYNSSETPEDADAAAIAVDWRIVGQHITDALHQQQDSKDAAA